MSSRVEKALEARKKRLQNESQKTNSKVDSAIEKYKQRKKNTSQVDISDLTKRLKEEEDAYNSAIKEAEKASYGTEAFKKTVESQRQHRLNINSLKTELESYRNRLGKDVDIDSVISSLDKMKSGYDAIASNSQLMSRFETEEDYNNAVKEFEEYES